MRKKTSTRAARPATKANKSPKPAKTRQAKTAPVSRAAKAVRTAKAVKPAKRTKSPSQQVKAHSPQARRLRVSRPKTPAKPTPRGRKAKSATPAVDRATGPAVKTAPGAAKTGAGFDLTEKIKELVRLAQEQGYLTYGDINDALPDQQITPEDLDEIYIKLRNLEVEIVDQAEVDRVKQPEQEEEDKSRLDILDDPVRMYLKQMGQVPLLTREQEVEISKRIEDADNEVKRIIYSFGFSGKEHIALAEKLISEPPKERFDRVILDKKIESRDDHLRALRRLVKEVRKVDMQVDGKYANWHKETVERKKKRLRRDLGRLDTKLQSTFPRFYYKQRVIEEMALVADNI